MPHMRGGRGAGDQRPLGVLESQVPRPLLLQAQALEGDREPQLHRLGGPLVQDERLGEALRERGDVQVTVGNDIVVDRGVALDPRGRQGLRRGPGETEGLRPPGDGGEVLGPAVGQFDVGQFDVGQGDFGFQPLPGVDEGGVELLPLATLLDPERSGRGLRGERPVRFAQVLEVSVRSDRASTRFPLNAAARRAEARSGASARPVVVSTPLDAAAIGVSSTAVAGSCMDSVSATAAETDARRTARRIHPLNRAFDVDHLRGRRRVIIS